MSIPFDLIASDLLARGEILCRELFPDGKREGTEFRIGNIRGDVGKSLSINLNTGVWKDFGADDAGADLISLYAAARGLSMGEAARALAPGLCNGYDTAGPRSAIRAIEPRHVTEQETHSDPEPVTTIAPPIGEPPIPSDAAAVYRYTDGFYVARFHKPDGSKTFTPFIWNGTTWVKKAPPKPRPLYGLDELLARHPAGVLIVEGEKTAEAARELLPMYAVLTWAGGASSIKTADWTPLRGRNVDIWPDADEPGAKAASEIAGLLLPHCPRVRIVRVSDAPSIGWDLADAAAEGWDTPRTLDWARSRIQMLSMPEPDAKTPQNAPKAGSLPSPGEDLPAYVLWEQLQLARNERGPYATEANALRIITSHGQYSGRIWLDEFSQRLMIDDPAASPPHRLFSRSDAIACLIWMQETLQLPKMPLSSVERAAIMVGERHKRHPVKAYLSALVWDQAPRLHTLLPLAFGAADNAYTQAVGRCWLVAMVARIFDPGCKADNVPVFEGPQGIMKSSALRAIGGEWFLETTENPLKSRKDFLQALQGKWLVEIPEIDRIGGRHGDLSDLTGVITIRTDSYRVPYGATTMDYPRQSVFAGTSNRSQWQPDETGGRRYWPVACGAIDIEWLTESRDQLFAEAVARHQRGESWWDVPAEAAKQEQESRRISDEWEDIIDLYMTHIPRRSEGQETRWEERQKPLEYAIAQDVFIQALGLPERMWDTGTQKRVAKAFAALGYEKTRPLIDGKRCNIYKKQGKVIDKGSEK